MSFKNRKRDDHGHVIGNDEVDGQECKHTTGGDSVKGYTQKDSKSFKVDGEKRPLNDAGEVVDESLDFDADYEEEFNDKPSEADEKQYVEKCLGDIETATDKQAFEYISDNIDELTEAGLISEETADMLYFKLDEKIDEVNSDNPLGLNLPKKVGDFNPRLQDIAAGEGGDPRDDGKPKKHTPTPNQKKAEMAEKLKANEQFKPKYEPEDFEDARFYPTKSNMDGNRWVGRYRGIGEALGLKDWNDERVKHVGDHNGTSMFQLPDGYYSINPNITSMSFKTKEALQDYIDRKNPEDHKYGVYFDGDIQKTYRGKGEDGKEYDVEGPDAYKAARAKKAENDLDPKQGLDKLGISQGFGKRVPKKEFEQYVKLLDEDKLKLRRQGYLQNYHGYDIEEIGGRDEYRVWKLGK